MDCHSVKLCALQAAVKILGVGNPSAVSFDPSVPPHPPLHRNVKNHAMILCK